MYNPIILSNGFQKKEENVKIINYCKYVVPKDAPKRIKTTKQAMESLENILFEIFPHPYYA